MKQSTTTTTASTVAATKSSHLTMESLALPQELYWDGKMEPISPPCSELFSISESIDTLWPYDDNFANEITLITEEDLELKPGLLEFSQELINCEDLVVELYDLKEEQWINSKLPSPPHLLDYPSIGTIVAHPNPITKVLQQSPLDGGGFFGLSTASATATLTELTPPHSPTQQHRSGSNSNAFQIQIQAEGATNLNDLIQRDDDVHQTQPASVSAFASSNAQTLPSYLDYATQSSVVLPSSFADFPDDIAAKTQLVDEIIQHAAKALPDWYEDNESQLSYSAPPSHAGSSDNTDEDEWMPSEEGSSSCNYASSSSNSASQGSSPVRGGSSEEFTAAAPTKKRTRPYGRGVEDRKIRKKEQNKNAATRYRQKKKLEMEHVLGEEHELAHRNAELRRMFAEKEREAKYLKTLIREFYQDKKRK